MPYTVRLTDDAASDLEDIWNFIGRQDSKESAEYVLTRIEEAFSGLSEQPSRGAFPMELLDIGLREYREIFFKPYRIIYRVTDDDLIVYVIADGRRDMRSLLERRLMRA